MGITLASFMALGTMPFSNDMFIIMESGTLHGSHSCFKRIMLMMMWFLQKQILVNISV